MTEDAGSGCQKDAHDRPEAAADQGAKISKPRRKRRRRPTSTPESRAAERSREELRATARRPSFDHLERREPGGSWEFADSDFAASGNSPHGPSIYIPPRSQAAASDAAADADEDEV